MATTEAGDTDGARPQPLFVTTHWSVVLAAKNKASPVCSQALETLCRTYWFPLYAFVRSTGRSPHDSQDLTQAFFARLLAKDYLRVVTPEKGRFRTFLRMALKRFLANDWNRVKTQKRGGGYAHVSFDTSMAEERFLEEPADPRAPDLYYDRRWALALVEDAMERLEREYATSGKEAELRQLKPHLMVNRGKIPYAQIAVGMRTSEGAARVALHRLRRRFREVYRAVVAETVANPEEVESEMRYVLEVLSRG